MAEKDKVSLTLHHEVIAAVDHEAQRTGRNRSNLVDYILRQRMNRKKT
mgnify:CR=1 FL=1